MSKDKYGLKEVFTDDYVREGQEYGAVLVQTIDAIPEQNAKCMKAAIEHV